MYFEAATKILTGFLSWFALFRHCKHNRAGAQRVGFLSFMRLTQIPSLTSHMVLQTH